MLRCTVQEWARQEDVVYARPLVRAGERVTSVEGGLPTWVAEVMVTKPHLDAALDFVRRVETEIDRVILITPDRDSHRARQAVPDCLSPSIKLSG